MSSHDGSLQQLGPAAAPQLHINWSGLFLRPILLELLVCLLQHLPPWHTEQSEVRHTQSTDGETDIDASDR